MHKQEEQLLIENFARYLFRQFIAGLQEIHASGKAHLDIKIENVFVDLQQHVDGMWAPCIQIAGLGKTTEDYLNVSHESVERCTAQEVLDRGFPYDGQKIDIFQSAFILLAIYANKNFSFGTSDYKKFIDKSSRSKLLKMSNHDLDELFDGMLNDDLKKRWNIQKIADCAWLNNYGEPNYSNIYTAIDKVIKYMHD